MLSTLVQFHKCGVVHTSVLMLRSVMVSRGVINTVFSIKVAALAECLPSQQPEARSSSRQPITWAIEFAHWASCRCAKHAGGIVGHDQEEAARASEWICTGYVHFSGMTLHAGESRRASRLQISVFCRPPSLLPLFSVNLLNLLMYFS
jgi:hypothetical protein